MMEKEVVITIKSSQQLGGEEHDGAELITRGTYRYKNGAARLCYDESELTGMNGTRTQFDVRDGEVVLSRRGAVDSRMVFQPGQRSDFLYRTEHGMLTLGLDTLRIDCELGEHGGDMRIDYDLDFERSLLSRNQFIINVKEKDIKS